MTISKQDTAFENLVVVRESNAHSKLLMEGMIRQTMAKARRGGVPGTEWVQRQGTGLFDTPPRGAKIVRADGGKMLTFEREGTLFVLAMVSAAKIDNESSTNRFLEHIAALVTEFKPANMWASLVNRFTRAPEFAGSLTRALMLTGTTVRAEMEMDLQTEMGKLLWQVLIMFAGMERDSIVKRNAIGRINKMMKGGWPLSFAPFGYRIVDGCLTVDEENLEAIRAGFRILANPNLTNAVRLTRLAELGLTSDSIRRHHGAEATYADATTGVLASLVGWVEMYRTGKWIYRETNPFPGIDELGGHEIDYRNETAGEIVAEVAVPLPEGGWVPDEVFDAIAVNIASRSQRTGGNSRAQVRPLLKAFVFDDDEFHYELFAGRGYQLHRRPLSQKEWKYDADHNRLDERLAFVNDRELHQSIVEGIVTALDSNGVLARIESEEIWQLDGRTFVPEAASIQRKVKMLRVQAGEMRRIARQAIKALDVTKDDDTIGALTKKIDEAHQESRRLEQAATELENSSEPQLGVSFKSNAAMVAEVLGWLAQTEGSVDQEDARRLGHVLTDCRMTADPKTVEWSVCVRIPTAESVVVLGPITGQVRNRKHPNRRRDFKSLRAVGLSDSACRVAASKPVLAEALRNGDRDHPEWVRHIRRVFADEFHWNYRTWQRNDLGIPDLLAHLVERGGRATVAELTDAGFAVRQIRNLYETRTGRPAPCTRTGDWKKGRPTSARIIQLQPCPNCGSWLSQYRNVPEIPGCLLCQDCRRGGWAEAPVFPDWYFN